MTERVEAVVLPAPPPEPAAVQELHGFLRGSVVMPPGIDLTEPVLDEPFSAAEGEPHEDASSSPRRGISECRS